MGCVEVAYRVSYRVSEKQGELTLEGVLAMEILNTDRRPGKERFENRFKIRLEISERPQR
jgi:hypothetical protein